MEQIKFRRLRRALTEAKARIKEQHDLLEKKEIELSAYSRIMTAVGSPKVFNINMQVDPIKKELDFCIDQLDRDQIIREAVEESVVVDNK